MVTKGHAHLNKPAATVFNKFEVIWSVYADHITSNFLQAVVADLFKYV